MLQQVEQLLALLLVKARGHAVLDGPGPGVRVSQDVPALDGQLGGQDAGRGGACLAFLLVMIGMFGVFPLVSFYLQMVTGYTALRTGVAFLPFAGAVLAASTLTGRVMSRLRPGLFLAAGLLLAATPVTCCPRCS